MKTILSYLALSGLAVAQDKAPDFFALGVGFTTEYSGSDDYQVIPFGAGRYSTSHAIYRWQGLSVSADFLAPVTRGAWTGGLIGRYRFDRDDLDDPAVDALPEIDASIDLGGFVGYQFRGVYDRSDVLTVKLTGLFDVSDTHEGFSLTPGASYSWSASSRWRMNLSLSANYASDDFLKTYYGITPEGSLASGLTSFEPGSGFYQASFSLGANYTLNEKWSLFGQLAFSQLLGDAADSPIVKDEGAFRGGIALSYRF